MVGAGTLTAMPLLRRPAAAWWVVVVAPAVLVAGAVLRSLNGSAVQEAVAGVALGLPFLGFAVVGALVLSARPGHFMGRLLCGIGLGVLVVELVTGYANLALAPEPPDLPGGLAAAWLDVVAGNSVFAALFMFLPLLFPDGRPPSDRWRPVAWAAVGAVAAQTVVAALGSTIERDGQPPLANPLGWPAAAGVIDVVDAVSGISFLPLVVVAHASLFVRLRRGDPVQRQQVKWYLYAASVLAGLLVVTEALGLSATGWVGDVVFGVFASAIPIAIGIAILRHGLFDIDVVINRTVLFLALTTSVVGLYIGTVTLLGSVVRPEGVVPGLVATGLVAVVFSPLRERLQRVVDRLVYGHRREPYAVISQLAQRLGSTVAPAEVLPSVVETVAGAMRLPFVAIELRDGASTELAAASGRRRDEVVRLPLSYQGEELGALVVGASEPLSSDDRKLLENLATQAGIAAHAVRLSAEVQRSRQRLVAGREEERRRLRRDLHDGLGPVLAGVAMKVEVAKRLIPRDPEATTSLLSDIQPEVQSAIADIRTLVYDLRPPALDDLGLVGAIRERATHLGGNVAGNGLAITVEAPESLPELPAAVEVAAYRITTEAMTNALRHAAGAASCRVRLSLNGDLEIQVVDDGSGMPQTFRPGVGVTSMRERAEELGGTLAIACIAPRGTRVWARLPLDER